MKTELIYPVDTANFRWIRENGFVYVDKTAYIHSLTKNKGKYYLLARPRRFGKSLFLDTLSEYFKGNKKLFNGLAIDSLQPGNWTSYPVIRFNLSAQVFQEEGTLIQHLSECIRKYEEEFNLQVTETQITLSDRFYNLLQRISETTGKGVVVLIDEYDAPLSASIGKPQLQEIFREQLHGFYSVLKMAEENIHFCFLTGVTRYGKVSVFSGLNNLRDISFLDEYAAICGITMDELRMYYLEGVKRFADKEKISIEEAFRLLKFNYDGYHFSQAMIDIYNPYSINNALTDLSLSDYWCRSGVPTLLSKSLMQNDFDVEGLRGKKVPESELSDLSMFDVNPIPLFYQTGYLTIKAFEERRQRYTLGYPNREVEASIMRNILKVYTHANDDRQGYIYDMEDALEEGKPTDFIKILSSFLSKIPNQLHKYVDRYENYYHTIFYCLTTLIGLDVEAEYSTSGGFIDILIKTANYIYIIELKVNGTAEDALAQIEKKNYAAPFAADNRQIVKIGLGFSASTHNIASALIR